MKHLHGIARNQIKYVFLGTVIGFIGGSTNYPLWYGIPILPVGNVLVSVYILCVAYAIIKYHLLDIEIILTRATIFLIVYTLVLGFPIWLSYQKVPWIFPMLLMGALASSGPFIYQYFQRRAEKRLLEEQRRYQDTLRKAAVGMNRINQLKKVFTLIVDLITSQMRVECTLIYALDDEKKDYVRQAAKYLSRGEDFAQKIPSGSPLAEYLKASRGIVAYDDMHHQAQANQEHPQVDVIRVLAEYRFHDALVLPVFIEDDLQAMIVVGKKQNGRIFTKDDVSVLMTLANQTALGMENSYHWAAETKRMEEEGLKVRSASVDRMGGSLAHEIDNPNTIIINEADYLKEALDKDRSIVMPDALRKEFKKTLNFIIDSAKRVSSMIDAILEYSKMGAGELKPVNINEALGDFLKIMTPQVKKEGVDFQVEASHDLPMILGDKVQLIEILMNFVVNSLHAVRQNQWWPKIVKLKVFLDQNGMVRLEAADNGYGIPARLIEDIFLPSVTTKSAEGTGLGLYRVRKIVDSYKGRVWAESEGRGKGAKFIVELPVAAGGGHAPQPPPRVKRIMKLK
ncbi:MAG: GAF domain-containing sensor histidine kinase [Candidatus Omnitrophica bacterium]|nr:GAF domain-containing sensor histidine kinase [Candidatus Omnitrophota bacterium]